MKISIFKIFKICFEYNVFVFINSSKNFCEYMRTENMSNKIV